MAVELRLPKINAPTVEGQMAQTQSYLYQMVEQLNWALNTIEAGSSSSNASLVVSQSSGGSLTEEEAEDTFESLKSLIINSADVVESYYQTIKRKLASVYLAKSDFGTYKDTVERETEETAKATTERFNSVQKLIDELGAEVEKLDYTGWIKTGILEYAQDGTPTIGVEVGRKNNDDSFTKFARFTESGIYFYLPGSNDAVAWMTGNKLFITHAQITTTVQLGNYKLDLTDGMAFKWVGGGS